MRKSIKLDWPSMTDEQVRLTRDYASSPKERRQARQELAERSALAAMRDELVRALAESGEEPGTKIRAQRELSRRLKEHNRRVDVKVENGADLTEDEELVIEVDAQFDAWPRG